MYIHVFIPYSSIWNRLQLKNPPIKPLRPNPILPRRENPLRIEAILNLLVEAHHRILVPVVRLGDLIHHREMRAVFAPAVRGAVGDEGLDEPVGVFARLRVFAVEDYADDVVCCIYQYTYIRNEGEWMERGRTHLSHPNSKSAQKVNPSFDTPLLGHRELQQRIIAGDLANGREEQMGTVGHPVDPFQLVVGRDPLEGLVAGMQYTVCADVLWEVEFCAGDGGEGLFDYLPEVVADEVGALYRFSVRMVGWLGGWDKMHSRITRRKSSIDPG